jgi:hypothetical protein
VIPSSRARLLFMNASNPTPEDISDGWSDLTEEEREAIRQAFAEAEEDERNGVPGIPMDEVLPRYRQAG